MRPLILFTGLLTITLGFCVVTPSSLQAAPVITIETSPFDYDSNLGGTQGFKFTVTSDVIVESLGVYDAGSDGIANPAEVGLWHADGTLLAQTTVPQGTAGIVDGQFRFTTIAPLMLTTGTEYVIGAFLDGDLYSSFSTDPSWNGFGGVGSIDSRFTILEDRYFGTEPRTGLEFPTRTDILTTPGVYGWIGPNLQVAPVPLPAAAWLFGSGIAGITALARRRSMFR